MVCGIFVYNQYPNTNGGTGRSWCGKAKGLVDGMEYASSLSFIFKDVLCKASILIGLNGLRNLKKPL